MSAPLVSDSQAVINSIRQIVHALQLGSCEAQKEVGLSGAQLFVLQTLAESSAMSVNDLAARSYTHQSSVSAVVSRLVDAKLVRRLRSPDDARRVELTVTPAGRRVLKSNIVMPQHRLFAALERFPKAKLAELRSSLEQVVSLSKMDSKISPMFLESQPLRK